MKRFIIPILFIFLGITSCYEFDPIEPDNIPILPIIPDIVYPPDTFKVIFPLRENSTISTSITFDSSAVWHIEKLNTLSTRLWVSCNYSDTTKSININDVKQIAFEKDIAYKFWCNNNNYPNSRNLIVLFRKETIGLSTHQ